MSPSEEHFRVYSNGGHMDYTVRETLYILPLRIYLNDNPIADTISLREVADYFHVTMYTKDNHAMLVLYIKDKAYHFEEYGKGLYYLYISNTETMSLKTQSSNTNKYFLYTVNANMY